ncbi:MAG: hypothetical protein ACREEL_03320 [Stellaceae bacterium]
MFTRRHLAVLTAGLAGLAAPAAAQLAAAVMTCTNPASGATWQIRIDFAQRTVDANSAHIDAAEIAWHDAKDGGNYTLDRQSGKLTFVAPSSTGGYFLYDRCAPAKAD